MLRVTIRGPAAFLVRTLAIALCLGCLAGCSTTIPKGELGAEADFIHGKELYDQERYAQAIEVLDAFRNDHPGSDRVDEAIFLLGMCHQKTGEHLLARDEFDRLLRDFPQSQHREEAEFERAMAWLEDAHSPALDADPTQHALDSFHSYLKNYPDGAHKDDAEKYVRVCLDRLATKAYLNGKTYLILKQPAAARVYFDKALQILSDSQSTADIYFGQGTSYKMEGNSEKARAAFGQVLDYLTPERIHGNVHLRRVRRMAEAEMARLQTSAARSG